MKKKKGENNVQLILKKFCYLPYVLKITQAIP